MEPGALYTIVLGVVIFLIVAGFWLSTRRSGTGAPTLTSNLILGRGPTVLPPQAVSEIETTIENALGAAFGATAGSQASAVVDSVVETTSPVTVFAGGQADKFYKLALRVTPADGGAPYPAEVSSTIPSSLLSVVRPGATIDVLVNPSQPGLVMPNWRPLLQQYPGAPGEPNFTAISMSGNRGLANSVSVRNLSFTTATQMPANLGALLSALPGGVMHTLQPGPQTLFVTGVRGTAVVRTAHPLGHVRDLGPMAAGSANPDDMLWQFIAEIDLPGAQPSIATFRHSVPASESPDLAPGVKLAIAVDDATKPAQCAVDWDQSPLP